MKRSLLFVLLLMPGILPVRAQFIDSYGLKTGLCIANQSFRFTPIDHELPTDVLIGPGALVFIETFKGKHLSFQLDLGVMFKGSKTHAASLTVDHMNNDRIVVNQGPPVTSAHQYFTFSPLARFEREYALVNIYASLGPRLDFLLNYSNDSPYPLEEQRNRILGLSGAFGLGYSLGKIGVFSEIQYQPDLSPVTNTEPLLVNNNALFFSLGIRIQG